MKRKGVLRRGFGRGTAALLLGALVLPVWPGPLPWAAGYQPLRNGQNPMPRRYYRPFRPWGYGPRFNSGGYMVAPGPVPKTVYYPPGLLPY